MYKRGIMVWTTGRNACLTQKTIRQPNRTFCETGQVRIALSNVNIDR